MTTSALIFFNAVYRKKKKGRQALEIENFTDEFVPAARMFIVLRSTTEWGGNSGKVERVELKYLTPLIAIISFFRHLGSH